MYSISRTKVNGVLETMGQGEAFTSGDVARRAKITTVTARKWLRYYVKYSDGWLVSEKHPYRKNVDIEIFKIVKGLTE